MEDNNNRFVSIFIRPTALNVVLRLERLIGVKKNYFILLLLFYLSTVGDIPLMAYVFLV